MKTIFKARFFGILIPMLLSLFFAPRFVETTAYGAEAKPVITLSVSSYKDIIDGSKKIAELIGFGDEFEQFETQFGKIPGTDNTKPLGLVLFTDEETFFPVAFLPVNDLDKLQKQFPFLEDWISENLESVSKGKYKFGGSEMAIEQKGDWTILYMESHKDIVPLDPTMLLNGLNKKHHGAIRVDFENTPEELVMQYIAAMEFFLSMSNPDVGEQIAVIKEQLSIILSQGKWLIEGFSIDPKSGNISGEVTMTVKSGGTLAEVIEYYAKGKTNHIGFFQPDQAISFLGYGLITDDQKETNISVLEQYIEAFQEGLADEIDDSELEFASEVVEVIGNVILETIQEGKIDWAVSLLTSGEIIFSSRIAKGSELGDVLKKAAEKIGEIDPDLKDLMKVEYVTFEGFRFSRVAIPLNILPQADEMPGPLQEKTIYLLLGIKDDSVCGVIGTEESRLETVLKKGITDSKTAADIPKKSFQFSLPLTAQAVQATGLVPKDPVGDAVIGSLAKAPKTAQIYANQATTSNAQRAASQVKFFVDGTIFSAVAKAVKIAQNAQDQAALKSDPFEKADNTPKNQPNSDRVKDFDF